MKINYVLFVICLTVVLGGCGGAEERKAAYLEKARVSIESGDLDKARIELKNVLQIDPKDVKAVFQLGEVYELKKNYQKAFSWFAKAVELEPKNTEYQAKLGTYYLLSGDNEKAREIIKKINEIDPANLDKDILNASLLFREKDIDGAVSLVTKMVNEYPDELRPMLLLAQLYKSQVDYGSALRTLEKAISLDDNNIRIKKDMVSLHVRLKNYNKAETLLKEILSTESDNYKNHIQLALFYKTQGDKESGEKILRDAIKLDEEDLSRKLALSSYLIQTKGVGAAEEELKLMIGNYGEKEANGLRLALAKIYHDSKASEKEIAVYKDIINFDDGSSIGMNARINLSKVYIRNKRIEDALSVINDALERSPNDPEALLLRATIALINDDTERAITDLRLVVKDKPESIDAYTLLVNAYLKNKEPEQAKETLNRAYENNVYDAQSLVKLADLNIKLKNIDGAEKAIDGVLRIEENNVKALVFKTKILNTRKEFQQAQEMATKIIKLSPKMAEGYQLIAPSMFNNGQVDELYALIKEGYEKTGYDLRLLEIMVSIGSGQKKYDSTIEFLKAEIGGRGEKSELYRMLAKVHDASGNPKAAINNFKKAINIKNDQVALYGELANIYMRTNASTEAIAILKQGKSVLPDEIGMRMSLAVLYEKFGQLDNAIAEYEDILLNDGDNALVINNLASLLSDYKTDKASLNKALELVEKLKDNKNLAVLDTVGWVYYKSGDYQGAMTVLESVVKQAPNVPVFNYHLGMVFLKLDNKEQAKIYLEKAVEDDAVFNGSEDAKKSLDSL